MDKKVMLCLVFTILRYVMTGQAWNLKGIILVMGAVLEICLHLESA